MNKKNKSIIKSDCIIDGVTKQEVLNITSNIHESISNTFNKLKLEANNCIPRIKDLIITKKYNEALELYQKYEILFPNNQEFFDLLDLIDINLIKDIEMQAYVVLKKLRIKELMQDWNYIKNNVPLILDRYLSNSKHIAKIESELIFIVGLANQNLNNNEVAIATYNELLNAKKLNYNLKACIYGNKALLENNTKYMELSSDLYKIAGNIKSAVHSKMLLADKIFGYAPQKTFQLIEESEELCKTDNIDDINLKSRIQYCKAIYLFNSKQQEKALLELQKTIKTISNLYGDEINERRYASYVTALQISQNLKNNHLCQEYTKKLKEIRSSIKNEEFNQQLLAAEAMELKDYSLLKKLSNKNPDNFFIKYGANIICSLADDNKTLIEKLALLDEIKKDIDIPEFTTDRKALLYRSYAILFNKYKQTDKYLEYSRLSLQHNPYDADLRGKYIAGLINSEKWSNLENFCASQIDIFGEFPDLMYIYAKSIYKQQKDSNSLSLALSILNKYKNQITKENREDCQSMIDNLIDAGIKPCHQYINKKDKPAQLLTLENFNKKLEEFKAHIQQKGRMRFWKNENGKYRYNPSPENIAKIAFIDFFKSEFGEQIEIIDEYKAGAGAIDLYVQFSKNINIIIELKMCGATYSSNYALEGHLQLKHYYENSGGTLCYLIIFDGRKNQNKKPKDCSIQRLMYEKQKYTIITRTINIYPKTK